MQKLLQCIRPMNADYRDLENITIENDKFRKVLFTVPNSLQLVVMCIPKWKDVGFETHNSTQFIYIVQGKCIAIVRGKTIELSKGSSIMIPSKTEHNIVNANNSKLKFYTIYSSPEH